MLLAAARQRNSQFTDFTQREKPHISATAVLGERQLLFNSLTFVVFFAFVVALHSAPLPWRVKKINLLIASLIFYGAWSPPFVLLLLLSTVVDWFAARWINGAKTEGRRRLFLLISLAGNLGMLSYFKYGGFLLENFTALMNAAGVAYKAPEWSIILPVGISFYTFQTLAYTLDVFLRRAAPTKSLLDFALFVTFFPQLVAGPIVRPSQLVPQFAEPKQATAPTILLGPRADDGRTLREGCARGFLPCAGRGRRLWT